jgi:isopentenyldiphosphate isomerase/very-short-patch-repair endonuclease
MFRKPTKETQDLKIALEKLGLRVLAEVDDGHKHIDLTLPDARINIEVDGSQHLTDPYQILSDLKRTHYSDDLGYDTIHIPNHALRSNLGGVASALAEAGALRIEAFKKGEGAYVEEFDILDKHGNLTGKKKPRSDVHRDGDWHKAVHVWIVNDAGQLLIQKRAPQKDSHPNKWDISAAGHISAGGTSLATAVREVEEELGIQTKESDFKYLFTIPQSSVQKGGTFINNEFDDVYLARLNLDISKLTLQKEEVSEVKWIDPKVLHEAYERKDSSHVLHPEEYTKLLGYIRE